MGRLGAIRFHRVLSNYDDIFDSIEHKKRKERQRMKIVEHLHRLNNELRLGKYQPFEEMHDVFDVICEFVKSWPEEDGEPLDLENWQISEVGEEHIRMMAGGDWQKGAYFTIRLDNGALVITDLNTEQENFEPLPYEELYKIFGIQPD